MKVSATSGTSPASGVSRSARATGTGGAFAIDKMSEAHVAAPVLGTSMVAAVDAILALQSIPDAMTGRDKAVKRADAMLDLLDQVRLGLLEGMIPKPVLGRLVQLVRSRREGFIDPRLQAVLDEIDVRAQVELAKLSQEF